MGFFKDFKDDFSQAVNELMPADDNLETSTNEDDVEVNTLEGEVDVETELSKLDGLLEQVTKQEAEKVAAARSAAEMAARNASARQKEQQYLCLHLYLNQKEMKQFQILQKQPRRKEKWLTIQQHL